MTENNGTIKKTMDEIGIDTYYDGLIDHIVSKWIKEGSKADEEELRQSADAMIFLIHSYNLKCLINTLFELYDDMEEYDKEIGLEE